MDPNATLEEIRELVQVDLHPYPMHGDVMRLCELVNALDQWMMRGGFPPKDWTPKGRREHKLRFYST